MCSSAKSEGREELSVQSFQFETLFCAWMNIIILILVAADALTFPLSFPAVGVFKTQHTSPLSFKHIYWILEALLGTNTIWGIVTIKFNTTQDLYF